MAPDLDYLFPVPTRGTADLSPVHWPGVSPESTEALLDVLKHSHEKWHTFYNEKRFHNHAPHRSLAIWAMGADGEVIRAGYDKDCGYEKPIVDPPSSITRGNFMEHLGDDRYYKAYLGFFSQALKEHGIASTLEEYIFSNGRNVGSHFGRSGHPQMLARFMSGVLHPLIHTGNGIEFGLPGLVAEGLAMTAVTRPDAAPLVPHSLWDSGTYINLTHLAESAGKSLHDAFGSTVQSLDAAFSPWLTSAPVGNTAPQKQNIDRLHHEYKSKDVHVLDILGWVAEDFRYATIDHEDLYKSIQTDSETIIKFSRLWKLDVEKLGSSKAYLNSKIEELAFLVTIMYGIGGWTGRGDQVFNADFYLMHLVTSSIFLPSICACLSPISIARFLHTYLALALGIYIFRGCPPLDIPRFQTQPHPQPTGPQLQPSQVIPSRDSKKAINPNSWLSIVQKSVVHPEEHVPKTQRALSHWASLFGTRRFGSKRAPDMSFSPSKPKATPTANAGNPTPTSLLDTENALSVREQAEGADTGESALETAIAISKPHKAPPQPNFTGPKTVPVKPLTSKPSPITLRDAERALSVREIDQGADTGVSAVDIARGSAKDSEGAPGADDFSGAASAGFGMGWGTPGVRGEGEKRVLLELKGAEYLDGTVFLRTAELTAERVGRMSEGDDEDSFWDFSGFHVSIDERGPKARL